SLGRKSRSGGWRSSHGASTAATSAPAACAMAAVQAVEATTRGGPSVPAVSAGCAKAVPQEPAVPGNSASRHATRATSTGPASFTGKARGGRAHREEGQPPRSGFHRASRSPVLSPRYVVIIDATPLPPSKP